MTADSDATAAAILALERGALDRWGRGDPGGLLDLYAADVTYFDPLTAMRIDGHRQMEDYYRPWTGRVHVARYEMLNPQVVVDGTMAVVTYNLVNYTRDSQGAESMASRWNATGVYQRRGDTWKKVHEHWSFTRHPAFANMSPESTEAPQR
jgi:ketosteroid isomerase-like protein